MKPSIALTSSQTILFLVAVVLMLLVPLLEDGHVVASKSESKVVGRNLGLQCGASHHDTGAPLGLLR